MLRAIPAYLVPEGEPMGANVRLRAGDVSDLRIVTRGKHGLDAQWRSVIWCMDGPRVVGFVMENEPVVADLDEAGQQDATGRSGDGTAKEAEQDDDAVR